MRVGKCRRGTGYTGTVLNTTERTIVENLESRDCPTIYGVWHEGMAHIINTAPFSYIIQSDPVVSGTNNSDRIELFGGPFTVYGLGGNDTIIGSAFSDTIYGGSGDDIIFGGDEVDYLYGEDGVDFLVGGTGEEPHWNGLLYERVLSALELTYTTENDYMDGGNDFNLIERAFSYNQTNVTYLTEGVYNWGDYKTPNLYLVGLGNVTFVGTRFDVINVYMENINIDIGGLNPYSQGYVNSFSGNVVLNNVEIYGQNNTNSPAIYFNGKVPTQVVMLNSYVHDTYGDGISTGGIQPSLLQLFNVRGERSGPAENNQVLTAHQGFSVVDVMGNYSDATSNVVAPDSNTRIDLYYTTISAGLRFAGVQLNAGSTIYRSQLYDQYTLNVKGYMFDTDIYTYNYTTTYFMTIQPTGKVEHCYVKKMGTSPNPYRNYGLLIDTVFEGWHV